MSGHEGNTPSGSAPGNAPGNTSDNTIAHPTPIPTGTTVPIEFDPQDLATHSPSENTQYTIEVWEGYEERGSTDDILLAEFRDDFWDWTTASFQLVSQQIRRKLKETLMKHGIYLSMGRGDNVPHQFYDLLQLKQCPKWPLDELAEWCQMKKFSSYRYPEYDNTGTGPQPTRSMSKPPAAPGMTFQEPEKQQDHNGKERMNTPGINDQNDSDNDHRKPMPIRAPNTERAPVLDTTSTPKQPTGPDVTRQEPEKQQDHKGKTKTTPDGGDPGSGGDDDDYRTPFKTPNIDRMSTPVLDTTSSKALTDQEPEKQQDYKGKEKASTPGGDDDPHGSDGDDPGSDDNESDDNDYRPPFKPPNIDRMNTLVLDTSSPKALTELRKMYGNGTEIKYGGTSYEILARLAAACRGVPAYNTALMIPTKSFEKLSANLHSAIGIWNSSITETPRAFHADTNHDEHGQCYTDRRYERTNTPYERSGGFKRGTGYTRGDSRGRNNRNNRYIGNPRQQRQKACFVFKQPGFWSTEHTPDERQRARNQWRSFMQQHDHRGERDHHQSRKCHQFQYPWKSGSLVVEQMQKGHKKRARI